VSTRDVPGSSRFKEAVDGVKFTAFRSSPTVSEGYMRHSAKRFKKGKTAIENELGKISDGALNTLINKDLQTNT
jgi:hypothetical protein